MIGWEWLGIGGLPQGSGTALGIPGTVRVSVPSQRGLRLPHSALRPQRPRQRPPSHDFGSSRIGSLALPSNEHSIQRDPNEVIIVM